MKKIVFVIEQLHGGGAERATAVLMNEMCKNAEVHLISTYDHDESKDYLTDERITKHTFVENCKNRVDLFLKRIYFLRKSISMIDPHCVVSLSACGTNTLLTVAMLGKQTPYILSERNDPTYSPQSKLLRILRLLTYSLCNGLVFQTADAQSYFSTKIARKSTVIRNPITEKLYPRYEGRRKNCIINCCRLVSQKNLELLLDAFLDISEEFPTLSLEIWGEGPEREHLQNRILSMGMNERISLPGYSSDIYSHMRECAMFVSSSDYEGISNSMLEAIALGVPTICTDCPAGGARATITDGENGLLVPTGDRRALAEAMRRILLDPELAEQISVNGCKLREEISAARISQQWMQYIDYIAD